MIGVLKGKVLLVRREKLVLMTGGVGYVVYSTQKLLSQLKKDTELLIYTYTHVKEEALELFGFPEEEELALFDILTRPNVKLTRKERKQVKAVAKELLETLKTERLVLDWRKHQQTRAAVELKIQEKLDELPEVYDIGLYQAKCERVYQHVYDSYYGAGKSIYPTAR